MRSIDGCGHHRPGALVCGYGHHELPDGRPCPGWVVGYFDPEDLWELLESCTNDPMLLEEWSDA